MRRIAILFLAVEFGLILWATNIDTLAGIIVGMALVVGAIRGSLNVPSLITLLVSIARRA